VTRRVSCTLRGEKAGGSHFRRRRGCRVKPLLAIFRHQPRVADRTLQEWILSMTHELAIPMPEATVPALLVVLL
jgi:hypothetical protein